MSSSGASTVSLGRYGRVEARVRMGLEGGRGQWGVSGRASDDRRQRSKITFLLR